MFFGIRQSAFFWYSAYIITTLSWRLLFSDHASAFIPASFNLLAQNITATLVLCSFTCAGMFCYFFLEVERFSLKVKYLLQGSIGFSAVMAFLSLFIPAHYSLYLIAILSLTVMPLYLTMAIYAQNRGQPTAKYYVYSWIPLFCAAIYTQLSIWQYVPSFDQRTILLDFAILLEALFLTIALSDK